MKTQSLLSRSALTLILCFGATAAMATPTFDRRSWTHWQGQWSGDRDANGNLDNAPYMTCVATDGSSGGRDYWAAGTGNDPAREAYQRCLDDVNVATRTPAYIEVNCGY